MATEMMERILSEENLEEAKRKVMSNKGSAGVDRMPVVRLPEYMEANKADMCEAIRKRRYRPLPVRRVQIPKEDGSKRDLGVPAVKDRWIEQATCQVLTPIFENEFSNSSYGFRPGRRAEQAIMKALEYMNDGYDWIVDLDLSKFFDNVNQDILMILVHNIIKDGDTESLIRKFLQSGVNIGDTISQTKIGTPQGGNLSPLLANIYLNELDKELEKRELRFTRYADDVLICVKSEVAANRVMASVTKWLKEKLRVEVNATKTKVARPNDIKYLGFGFYKDTDKCKPKPHIKSIEKFKKKLHDETIRSVSTSIAFKISKLNPIIRGWINYFRISSMEKEMVKLDRYVRIRIRMCIWKQWKTPQKKMKSLIKLGVNKNRAKRMAYSRKGPMRCVNNQVVRFALRNDILKKKGLLSLVDHYQLVQNF